ncbi:hypothetical protein GCM10007416_32000 [Kroppenstedtia guangzhouensis]|uniref:Phage-related minor tail protein n=1 Tax=Kroppenstedtia guangzhouensis TaxID=1274356 RepID=A0ABQ1H4B8_9BACL|nr:replication protein [Kroppenstedtia guangzhouensis]GGA56408.1 hypothetical protein GCM10007416_32000 [Kroppenstedtia guangzhouensis]
MARKRIQGITIELDGETKGLDKALSDVNKRSRSLQQELRDVDRLLKFDPGNVEALAQKQQLLTQQIENTTERLNRLKSAQSQVEKQFKRGEIGEAQYRAFRREIQYTETQLKKFEKQLAGLDDGKSLDNLKQDLQGVSKEAKETEGAISELGSAIGGLAAGGGIAGAVSQALDSASLKTKIEISMEVPPESVGAVRDSIKTVTSYIDDQESAIEGVRRQWALNADASDAANARIVKGAGAIARAYAGIDFTELIQETNEVSRSLDISNDDALGLINSLLKIGFPPEQLDIIAEYGTQLKMAGYDAEEIQAIFAAGVETGSWNIDNLLDGLKEGRIRLAEFGEEVPKAVKDLLDGTEISAKQLQQWGQAVAKGGETGKQAMYEVAQAINGVEDETTKNALGVAVWGTMYEDQGQAVIDTILGAKDQTVDLKENQDQLNDSVKQLDQDPAVQFAQAMQDLKVALAPLLSVIADIISKIAEWVQNNPQLAATIAAIVTAVGIFIGLIAVLGPILTGIGTVVGIVAAAFGVATSTIWIIIGAIVALIAIGAALWTNWDTIKAKAIEVWGAIKEWLAQTWESIKQTASNVWNGITSFFSGIWESIKGYFNQAIAWIVSIVGERFQVMSSLIQSIMSTVRSILTTVWNYIKNTFRNALDFVKALVTGDFKGMKNAIRNQMDNVRATIRNIWNRVMAFFRGINLSKTGRDIIQGLINGIKRMASSVTKAVTGVVDGAINWAKKKLGIASPSRVFMELGEYTGEGFKIGISSMLGDIRRVSDQMAQTAISTTTDSVGSGSSATAPAGAPIIIQELIVREEADIDRISKKLWRLQQRRDRRRI